MTFNLLQQRTKALASLRAFVSPDSEIPQIIELCHLWPQGKGYQNWVDYQGYQLHVGPHDQISIGPDKNFQPQDLLVHDLHHFAPITTWSQLSTQALIVIVKTSTQSLALNLWLWGTDQEIRQTAFDGYGWLPAQPLLSSGPKTLQVLIKNLAPIAEVRQILNNRLAGGIAGTVQAVWVTPWPIPEVLAVEIKQFTGLEETLTTLKS